MFQEGQNFARKNQLSNKGVISAKGKRSIWFFNNIHYVLCTYTGSTTQFGPGGHEAWVWLPTKDNHLVLLLKLFGQKTLANSTYQQTKEKQALDISTTRSIIGKHQVVWPENSGQQCLSANKGEASIRQKHNKIYHR